uniref:Bowman-Birk serine protease inhibitors family domain-containing protein n=1 Tax=Hordeum vulgare subsp. vulgare TaxID=112509 RepID=A0A8I6Y0Q0_HORVV
MDKYMTPVGMRVLLQALLLLVCLATTTKCRIVDDTDNDKISLPGGLCVHRKNVRVCKMLNACYCCYVTNLCYETVDECQTRCKSCATMAAIAAPPSPTLSPLPSI